MPGEDGRWMSTLLEILGELKQHARHVDALLEAHQAQLKQTEQWRREQEAGKREWEQWRREQEAWKRETSQNMQRVATLLYEISGVVQDLHSRVSKLESDKAPD